MSVKKRTRALKSVPAVRRSERLTLAKLGDLKVLPQEIFDQIAGEVALGDKDRTSARNLTSLRLATKPVETALRGSPAGKFLESSNKAGKTAERAYLLLPSGDFHEEGDVSPEEYANMMAPGLHLLSGSRQSKVVNKVLNVRDDAERASALNKIASHPARIRYLDQQRLLDSAITLIEFPAIQHRSNACKAVAKLYAYRTPRQHERILAARQNDAEVARAIDEELGARSPTSTVLAPSPEPESPGGLARYRTRQQVAKAAEDIRREVAKADEAHAFLERSMRDRSGRG